MEVGTFPGIIIFAFCEDKRKSALNLGVLVKRTFNRCIVTEGVMFSHLSSVGRRCTPQPL